MRAAPGFRETDMTQPIDPGEAAAAQAAGMAASDQRQSDAYDPMGGSELRPSAAVAQPHIPPEPGGDGEQEGVT